VLGEWGMTSLDLSRVGNVRRDYVLPNLGCQYRGLHFNPVGFAIKDYALPSLTSQREIPAYEAIGKLLSGEIQRVNGKRELGLGFVVVSAGTVNLSMWREDYPHLPLQTLWTPTKEGFEKVNLDEENSYCVFEMAIAAHEANAWKRFLNSPRRGIDKLAYINDLFSSRHLNKAKIKR
jgi:hypothetical protein